MLSKYKPLQSIRGLATTELALVVPFILLFGLAGVELSRSLRIFQLADRLSYAIADVAYRECTSIREGALVEKCLREVMTDSGPLFAKVSSALGDDATQIQIVTVVHNMTGSAGSACSSSGYDWGQRFFQVDIIPGPGGGKSTSSSGDGKGGSRVKNLGIPSNLCFAVSSEVRFKRTSLFGFFPGALDGVYNVSTVI